jgi:hypothetical protein
VTCQSQDRTQSGTNRRGPCESKHFTTPGRPSKPAQAHCSPLGSGPRAALVAGCRDQRPRALAGTRPWRAAGSTPVDGANQLTQTQVSVVLRCLTVLRSIEKSGAAPAEGCTPATQFESYSNLSSIPIWPPPEFLCLRRVPLERPERVLQANRRAIAADHRARGVGPKRFYFTGKLPHAREGAFARSSVPATRAEWSITHALCR